MQLFLKESNRNSTIEQLQDSIRVIDLVQSILIICGLWSGENTRKPLGYSCFRIMDLVATMTNSGRGDYSMPSSQRMESAPSMLFAQAIHVFGLDTRKSQNYHPSMTSEGSIERYPEETATEI